MERNDSIADTGPIPQLSGSWAALPLAGLREKAQPRLAPAALRIGPEARWFQVPNADPQDLRRRRPLRAIMSALASRHREGLGAALSLEELLAIGWPGERVLPTAGANRVYVALTTLRNMGLRGCLILQRKGWLLDPELQVEHAR